MKATIIADASYCDKKMVAGYGYWIASTLGKLGGGGRVMTPNVATVNAAEMMAICNALHIAMQKRLVDKGAEILFETDSIATIGAYTGTRKITVQQELDCIAQFERLVSVGGFITTFKHVKGHTGLQDARSIANALCDKRAKKYMRFARLTSELCVVHREMKQELACSKSPAPQSSAQLLQPWRFPQASTVLTSYATTVPSLENLLQQMT